MNLTQENTICLVIDFQSKLIPHIFEAEETLDSASRLIKGLKLLNVPIIVTEQYPKGLGFTHESIQTALADDYKPLLKDTFSCYGDDKIIDAIKLSGRQNVIVCGIEAHICVMQTVLDLLRHNFNPFFIANAISSRSHIDKEYAIKRMIKEGAFAATHESALMELTVGSNNPIFKEISKIIK